MQVKSIRKTASIAGLVIGAALMAPQVALADSEKVTVCKKIAFFDKIHFKFVNRVYSYNNEQEFDVKVPDKLSELADLKEKVKWWFEYYKNQRIDPSNIKILGVSVTAVCVVHQEEKKRDRYDSHDVYDKD